jgi:uncharacterized membrane protein
MSYLFIIIIFLNSWKKGNLNSDFPHKKEQEQKIPIKLHASGRVMS